MKYNFIQFIVLLIGFVNFAQQDAQFTQYMYNTININPAYAGSRGVLSIFGLHRNQWVGIDGAPTTNSFSINSPVGKNLGLGISAINDIIGPTANNTIAADLSYSINTSSNYKLSFGIKITEKMFNLDVSKLNPMHQNDPKLQNIKNEFNTNFGGGLYLHSQKNYFGFSIPNLIQNKIYNPNEIAFYNEKVNFYFISGTVFEINPNIKFKPAFLAKFTEGAPLQLDISGNFLFDQKFVLGTAYRWNAAVSAMVGFQVSENLFLGYGYDKETTRLSHYNSGSHEIFLRFELKKSYNRIITPRFF